MKKIEEFVTEKPKVTIKIKIDKTCDMASVYDSEGNGMEGNFWDFHNGCHGINEFGKFKSKEELIERLSRFHVRKGKEVVIERMSYKY